MLVAASETAKHPKTDLPEQTPGERLILHPEQFSDEHLFFGTVPVYFCAAPGIVRRFLPAHFQDSKPTAQAREIAHLRCGPQTHLGPDYSALIVPGMPCTDIDVDLHPECHNVSALPPILQQPLIKVPPPVDCTLLGRSVFVGVASGVRSALVNVGGKWYRLKGCGNHAEGFVITSLSPQRTPMVIRGCSFEWTTHRELYMTQYVEKILATHGLVGANSSVGWFHYNIPNQPLPSVARTCVVLTSRGERRLNDHVLLGLDKLLPVLLDVGKDWKDISAVFPAGRVDDEGGIIPSWLALTAEMGPPFADLYNVALGEHALPDRLPTGCDPRFQTLWETSSRQLTANLALVVARQHELRTTGWPCSILAYVYWRFGREVGTKMRLLREARICWGTYQDAMGMHCNAHTNNLVLLPERVMSGDHKGRSVTQDAQFLAMLDLDMAFTADSHLAETAGPAFVACEEDQIPEEKRAEVQMTYWLDFGEDINHINHTNILTKSIKSNQ
jgi:hypothetical protein